MSKIRSAVFLSIAIYLALPVKYSLAQDSNLPNNINGSYRQVEKVPIIDSVPWYKPTTLYQTIDGLIIDNYKTQKQSNGDIKVEMDIYNPIMIGGRLKIYNADGSIDTKSSQDIEAHPDVSKNMIEQGGKIAEDYARALTGQEGTPFDIFRYSILDPRQNIRKQKVEVILKPGQTLEVTNRDEDSLILETVTSIYDYVTALAKMSSKDIPGSDDIKTKKFLAEFAKEMREEIQSDLTKEGSESIITSNINLFKHLQQGKPLNELFNKPIYEKYLTKFSKLLKKNYFKGSLTNLLDKGTSIALEAIGAGGVAKASEYIYKGVSLANPLIKLQTIDRLNRLRQSQGLLIANIDGIASYPNDLVQASRPSNTNQTDVLLVSDSCLRQSGSSHIGSASCSFKTFNPQLREEAVAQNNITHNGAKIETIQEKNQYTNGQIIRTPFDITLTWNQNGSTQLDLDSHLATPNGQHVFFQDRGNLDSAPNAFLYRDVISQKGAEQTRVTKLQDGEYRFYIHNYSDGGSSGNTSNPNRLSNSSAQVKIFEGGKPLTNVPNDPNNYDLSNPDIQAVGNAYPNGTFNVPTNTPGNTWSVFRLNARTGILTPVNTFGNASSSDVPKLR